MKTFLEWVAAFAIGLVALVGLIALINSRDQSGVHQSAAGPGRLYTGKPALSPTLTSALRRGNVVVLYRDAKPPAGTDALVPPGGKALVEAGQSVVVDRAPKLTTRLAAVAAKRYQEANSPQQLAPFVEYWLGH